MSNPANALALPNDMLRLIHPEKGEALVAKPGPDAPADPRTGLRDLDPLNEERKELIESMRAQGYQLAGESFEKSIIPAGSIQPKAEPINSDKVSLTITDLQNLITAETAKAVAQALEAERAKKPAKAEKA